MFRGSEPKVVCKGLCDIAERNTPTPTLSQRERVINFSLLLASQLLDNRKVFEGGDIARDRSTGRNLP